MLLSQLGAYGKKSSKAPLRGAKPKFSTKWAGLRKQFVETLVSVAQARVDGDVPRPRIGAAPSSPRVPVVPAATATATIAAVPAALSSTTAVVRPLARRPDEGAAVPVPAASPQAGSGQSDAAVLPATPKSQQANGTTGDSGLKTASVDVNDVGVAGVTATDTTKTAAAATATPGTDATTTNGTTPQ